LNRLALAVALPLALLFAAACQPAIQVQPAKLLAPVATVAPSAHAIAIVGVTFDPPLEYSRIIMAGGVSLIVAIHNQGQSPEFDLTVTARLLDPSGVDNDETLLNETAVIEHLEPGDIRLVRFNQVTMLPARGRYELVVEVSPVSGEQIFEDNSRVYEIVINDSE